MVQTCPHCRQTFEVLPEDLAFYDSISPVFTGKKWAIPAPQLCPECRFQRRTMFRNERYLYHRKSDLSGKQIISTYAPDVPYKVYDQDEWHGDKWSALQYGRDFDFNKTFTEQFVALNKATPHISLNTRNVENSYYTNFALNAKNSYLLFGAGDVEDSLYSDFVSYSKDVVDCSSLYSCELCYEGIASKGCYNCSLFINCLNCSDCLMVEDCQSCKNCLLCFGLNTQEYCFLNEPVGKEKFMQYKKELFPLTNEKIKLLRQKFETLKAGLPHRSAHIYMSEDCTGDMIFNSKNCHYAFDIRDCEDSKFLCFTPKSKCSYDATFNSPDGVEFCYNVCSTVGTRSSMATFISWYNDSIYYCTECHDSQNLFGCIGLKHQKYCILNKQYSEKEYENLAAKITEHMQKTGEWGEYFQPEASCFAYNQTVAHEHFPLSQEGVEKQGWRWQEEEKEQENYLGPNAELPQNIAQVPEKVCEQIFLCTTTRKPYKINPQELRFYQKMGLPLPEKCPLQRHHERIGRRNPRRLWPRVCGKCGEEAYTTYAPDRPEIIFCETCSVEDRR